MQGRSGGVSSICEDCLEVCFVRLVAGRICVWCLVIVLIFMGFGQTGVKRCEGCLKVINWGWWCKWQKGGGGEGGSFHREGRFSLCSTAVLWNFIASLTGYCKRFYWIPLFTILLLFYVFEVGKAKSATQSVLIIITCWAILEKFLGFLLYPWKFQTKQSFKPGNST